jgi:hypothetical protein
VAGTSRRAHDHALGIAEAFAITPRFYRAWSPAPGCGRCRTRRRHGMLGGLVLHEAIEIKYSPGLRSSQVPQTAASARSLGYSRCISRSSPHGAATPGRSACDQSQVSGSLCRSNVVATPRPSPSPSGCCRDELTPNRTGQVLLSLGPARESGPHRVVPRTGRQRRRGGGVGAYRVRVAARGGMPSCARMIGWDAWRGWGAGTAGPGAEVVSEVELRVGKRFLGSGAASWVQHHPTGNGLTGLWAQTAAGRGCGQISAPGWGGRRLFGWQAGEVQVFSRRNGLPRERCGVDTLCPPVVRGWAAPPHPSRRPRQDVAGRADSLRVGCHGPASSGSTTARQVLVEACRGAQCGQPAPCIRARIAARYSWPRPHASTRLGPSRG